MGLGFSHFSHNKMRGYICLIHITLLIMSHYNFFMSNCFLFIITKVFLGQLSHTEIRSFFFLDDFNTISTTLSLYIQKLFSGY